jgi:hypothetical protein
MYGRVEGLLGQISRTDLYHEKYWYTSQLFDPEWIPRETLEHSPAMGEPSTLVGLPAVEAESHVAIGPCRRKPPIAWTALITDMNPFTK